MGPALITTAFFRAKEMNRTPGYAWEDAIELIFSLAL